MKLLQILILGKVYEYQGADLLVVSHKLKPFRGSCTALLAEEGTKPGIDYSSVATVNNF